MKVLLNIYIHCFVVHSYGISCSTSSSSYSSSLSAYSFWQSSEHRQRSVQTSPAFGHRQRLLEQQDLAHLHRTSCIIAFGAGGRFVMMVPTFHLHLAIHSFLVRATPGLLHDICSKQEAGSALSVWLDGDQLVWAASSQT